MEILESARFSGAIQPNNPAGAPADGLRGSLDAQEISPRLAGGGRTVEARARSIVRTRRQHTSSRLNRAVRE
jgi:hypothetical protein